MINEIKDSFNKIISIEEVNLLKPIHLAYIGDAIYEVYIRKYIILNNQLRIKDINAKCIRYVKATSQADIINNIFDELNEEEKRIVKRGRNSTSNTIPKNTQLIDYKMATGFETLIGYLYLTGNTKRLENIIFLSIEHINKL